MNMKKKGKQYGELFFKNDNGKGFNQYESQ